MYKPKSRSSRLAATAGKRQSSARRAKAKAGRASTVRLSPTLARRVKALLEGKKKTIIAFTPSVLNNAGGFGGTAQYNVYPAAPGLAVMSSSDGAFNSVSWIGGTAIDQDQLTWESLSVRATIGPYVGANGSTAPVSAPLPVRVRIILVEDLQPNATGTSDGTVRAQSYFLGDSAPGTAVSRPFKLIPNSGARDFKVHYDRIFECGTWATTGSLGDGQQHSVDINVKLNMKMQTASPGVFTATKLTKGVLYMLTLAEGGTNATGSCGSVLFSEMKAVYQ